ncbi:MAG: aminopeptidase [Bacteroidales bacterium]|nr:aminopeptidase [Bacteroidales bacterium]MCF8405229.1 aminopeptidase [Bacteroidales bacterium]
MKHFLSGLLVIVMLASVHAQETDPPLAAAYNFEIIKDIPTTSVKNQYRSGTCWSFSGISFIESELIRKGKGEFDLSEMFVVRNSYEEKAVKYVRFQGNFNFSGGGAFHDVTHVIQNYGIVPEEAYPGLLEGEENHIHGELDALSKAYMDAVIKNKNKKLSKAWFNGYKGILDAYLGEYPESFTYKGQEYTPESFAASLDINVDDYVEIGSYTHHPFYEKFIIEVPDNWLLDEVYNIPLDEMMAIIKNSVENGYTVAWGSDVSEKGFSWKNGVAIVPEEERTDLTGTEKEKWEKLTKKEKEDAMYSFDAPVKEKVITQALRQEEFDNYQSTDDHGMLITGLAKDEVGTNYYKVKNSWGDKNHKYNGYFFASESFVALKTIDIMVHKDAIPKAIRKKLGL